MDSPHRWHYHGLNMVSITTRSKDVHSLNGHLRNRAGVDALALDPQDDSKVYMALGEYTNRSVFALNQLTDTW